MPSPARNFLVMELHLTTAASDIIVLNENETTAWAWPPCRFCGHSWQEHWNPAVAKCLLCDCVHYGSGEVTDGTGAKPNNDPAEGGSGETREAGLGATEGMDGAAAGGSVKRKGAGRTKAQGSKEERTQTKEAQAPLPVQAN